MEVRNSSRFTEKEVVFVGQVVFIVTNSGSLVWTLFFSGLRCRAEAVFSDEYILRIASIRLHSSL